MKTSVIIKHVSSILIFIVALVFGILGIFGVKITVNQSDINNIIFGLGATIGGIIEIVPFMVNSVKNGEYTKLLAIVNDVVYAVEEIPDQLTSVEKKKRALHAIEEECIKQNIKFDLSKADIMIESLISLINGVVKGKK